MKDKTARVETPKLTRKNLAVYEWIHRYMTENFRSPTIREIMAAFNLRGPAPIQFHLDRLRAAGYIEGAGRTMRCLKNSPSSVPPTELASYASELRIIAEKLRGDVAQRLRAIADSISPEASGAN